MPRQPEAGARTGIDTSAVGLVTIDTGSAAITSCNDAFAEVVGRAADDVLGCLITDFIDGGVRSAATAVIGGIRAGFISSVDGNIDLRGQAAIVGVDCWIRALGTDRPQKTAMAAVIAANGTAASRVEPTELGLSARPHRPRLGWCWRHWTRTGGSST